MSLVSPLRPAPLARGLLFAIAGVTSGCGGKAAAPAPVPEPLVIDSAAVVVPVTMTDTVLVRDSALDARVARLELRLLERDAQVNELQARLDQARQEAVRAMAKLQSLATRAEGASGIAEAEVAVQALRGSAGQRPTPEYTQAKRLLEQSSTEFNRQNYGGAVYLANQAKGLASRGRVGDGRGLRGGEVAFALPVPLVVSARCNVREGPGTGTRVLFALDAGVTVTGLSYVEGWVRVSAPDGRLGWVSRALVGSSTPIP